MRTTIIRLILFVLFALLFLFVVKVSDWILWAFIATYVFEPLISEKLK